MLVQGCSVQVPLSTMDVCYRAWLARRWTSLLVLCTLLAAPQTNICLAFVLQQRTTVLGRSRLAVGDAQERFRSRTSLRPSQSHVSTRQFHPLSWNRVRIVSPLGAAVESFARGDGTADSDGVGSDNASVETETERLMSVPTIDIKLELQMRGVEHRDAFEKIDLARRLAEARLSSSSTSSAAAPGSRGFSKASSGEAAADQGGVEPVTTKDSNPSSWWSKESEYARPPSADVEDREKGEDEKSEEEVQHARYVSRAMLMGKAAVIRELNAMGISHSRLSDLAVLARQYASVKREAHDVAKEAHRFGADEEVDYREEAVRLVALGTAELNSRLNALKVDFSKQASEFEMAKLLAKAMSGKSDLGPLEDSNADHDGEESKQDDDRKKGWGWDRWTKGLRRDEESAPAWDEQRGNDDEEEEEADDERRVGRPEWSRNGGAWEVDDDNTDADSEADWSIVGNASSDVDDGEASKLEDLASAGRSPTADAIEAPLRARAGRMSSRELMSALDSLGVHYSIPSPRADIEEAFVAAVLKGQEDARKSQEGRTGTDIVEVNPVAAVGSGQGENYKPAAFETYHSALRWARRLNFDDVVDELRYRGVEFDSRGDFSYLTRLLADEVLADEELMEKDESNESYRVHLEAAMSMSVEDICHVLTAQGKPYHPAFSKPQLAMLLAEANTARDASEPGSIQEPTSSNSSQRRRPRSRGYEQTEGATASDDTEPMRRKKRQRSPTQGVGKSGLFILGDDEDGPLSERDEALEELESIARSVGGAAWVAVQETGSLLAGVASTLLPGAMPNEDDLSSSSSFGAGAGGETRRREASAAQARRARMVRERAGGMRRGASEFVQSSANRAGLAVARSAANGVLRGAEAAADWAGGGAVSREYVLLFIAGFCLAFKRGVGSSVALLIIIRAGRISLQRLLAGGRAARGGVGTTASGSRRPTPASAGSATSRRRPPGGASRVRRASASSRKPRRPPATRQRGDPKRSTSGSRKPTTGGPGRASRTTGTQTRRRLTVDDSDSDDWGSDRGCSLM